MTWLTHQETIVIEKLVVTHSSQEEGALHTMQGLMGEALGVSQEAEGAKRGERGLEPLSWFLCEEMGKAA